MSAFGYIARPPSPPLAGSVGHLWALSDAPPHARERVLPSGTLELVVNLHEDEFRILRPEAESRPSALRGAMISGVYDEAFVVETRAHASIVGVHFEPGRAAAFLGVPAGALADTHVELDALWGRRASELRERLCAVTSVSERLTLLEQYLLRARIARSGVRAEVAFALEALGARGASVGAVAQRVQLSRRRFIELFREQVGMTPKRYAIVRRFRRALRSATASRAPDWSEIALQCGYSDQAHLCHAFFEFTGMSPTQLLRHRNTRVKDDHVAMPNTR